MTDDPDHLPCLVIPPDHPLAEKLSDAVTDEEAIAVIDAYREEVGGQPGQKVSLTYKGRRAAVTARGLPLMDVILDRVDNGAGTGFVGVIGR